MINETSTCNQDTSRTTTYTNNVQDDMAREWLHIQRLLPSIFDWVSFYGPTKNVFQATPEDDRYRKIDFFIKFNPTDKAFPVSFRCRDGRYYDQNKPDLSLRETEYNALRDGRCKYDWFMYNWKMADDTCVVIILWRQQLEKWAQRTDIESIDWRQNETVEQSTGRRYAFIPIAEILNGENPFLYVAGVKLCPPGWLQ